MFEHRTDIKLATATVEAIEAAVVAKTNQQARPHLGASEIGKACARALWYGFRWTKLQQGFDGRMLRLFARGNREEPVFVKLLRDAGITVHEVNPDTGRQFSFSGVGGHFGGSMDGCAVGIKEAPATWHVLEFKTSGGKAFAKLAAEGVLKAKPEHWAQMQCYMGWTGMERALYLAVNKDTDEIHAERINADPDAFKNLVERAESIITAQEPPERIGGPDWYECKWCNYRDECHGESVPDVNCRTCLHSTPELSGGWHCALHESKLSTDQQRKGCDGHRFIPATLANFAKPVDGGENFVVYESKHGGTFTNGTGDGTYTSAEIKASAQKVMLTDQTMQGLKAQFAGARVVG